MWSVCGEEIVLRAITHHHHNTFIGSTYMAYNEGMAYSNANVKVHLSLSLSLTVALHVISRSLEISL